MSQIEELNRLLKEIRANLPDGFPQRIEYLENQLKARKWAHMPGLELEKDKFSFCRALPYIKAGVPLENWKNAGVEAEVFRQTAKLRTMSTTDDEAGGYLVPAQAMPEFIEMLNAEAVVIRMGARMLPDLVGSPVTIVKQKTGATAYWVGEGDAPTPSDLTVGQVKMVPKKVMALTYVNNELIRRANPGAEAIIRQDFAKQLGLAIDLAALRGSGSENQPLGIANTSGINTVTWGTGGNGATLGNSLDLFWKMEHELALDNALSGSLGFLFHPAIRLAMKLTKIPQFSTDDGGWPLIPAIIAAGLVGDRSLAEAIGYPFATTTQLPINLVVGNKSNCTEVFFGNWQELLIGQWAGFEILASNVAGTAFATDQTWVRIIAEVDFALRHPESFCLCNDLAIA
jgi:HK97 family phage major capsid protein